MAADDMLERIAEPEVAVGAAAAALILSPMLRRLLRQSAVYGLAGLIMAGDAIGRIIGHQDASIHSAGQAAFVDSLVEEARAERRERQLD